MPSLFETICDTIIVGGGLAGACAALHLSRHERIVLLEEAARPAAGASGAAAGLVNPLMGRRAKAVWHMEAALEAFQKTLDLAGAASLFQATGVLRPAGDPGQAACFQEVAQRRPEDAVWLSAGAVRERYPEVRAVHGALRVRRGGALSIPRFVEALLHTARRQGAAVRAGVRALGWDEADGAAFVDVEEEGAGRHRLQARRVLLALGYGYARHAALKTLPLHGVKGQTVRVARPDGLRLPLPLSGRGYVVPDGETLVVGSSYEHTFDHLAPTERQTRCLLDRAAQMLPGFAEASVVEATAGVRVGVAGTRLPLLGPLPGRARLWIFTGLGSKGLLMAPLLARALPDAFVRMAALPPEVRLPA